MARLHVQQNSMCFSNWSCVRCCTALTPPPSLLYTLSHATLHMQAGAEVEAAAKLGKEAVLRTTLGDIRFRLFGEECPRTVENFCGHARSGYYDGVIFHRVIKG
jgi:Cyclophilin type peptidyl-prolyl cis-trans isomerase/CLD